MWRKGKLKVFLVFTLIITLILLALAVIQVNSIQLNQSNDKKQFDLSDDILFSVKSDEEDNLPTNPMMRSQTDNWWNNNWNHYRIINITNANNSYQIFINVSRISGGDVNCNGHCNINFGDIRFIDIDNISVLDYWIEKIIDGKYAWFWVELPSDIETDKKILMYYGNNNAISISNGDATFLWFDDFSTNTSRYWDKIQSNHNEIWNLYNTKYNTSLHSVRFRSKVDCVDIDSRNWGGHIHLGMKVENNTDLYNWSGLMYSYNTDRGADETHPASFLYTINTSHQPYPGGEKILEEGTNGYITEWLYSYPDKIIKGRIWDSSDGLLWDRNVSDNFPDNLTYLYFNMIDRHNTNGGDGAETGVYYDEVDEQLIAYCKGSHDSPSDSWLELHYSWMFLSKYTENEPSIADIGMEQSFFDIYVDDDAPSSWYDTTHVRTIQEGVDNASTGNTVYVYNGTYHETVVVNKRLDLIGEYGGITVIHSEGVSDSNGIYISADYVNISNFKINWEKGNRAGIYINSKYNKISNNKIRAWYGIHIKKLDSESIIENNTIASSYSCGIFIESSKNLIKDNIIKNTNGKGILITNQNSIDNRIFENNITDSSSAGISIEDTRQNIIEYNYVKNSLSKGIVLDKDSSDNLIFHNNIISNNPNTWDEGTNNNWYNSTINEGNYYNDYSGTDGDGDGIGDIPYPISGGSNQDNYPLMNPITDPPTFVWVDDDFNSTIPRWNTTHFNYIEDGIDAVAENGTVYVFNGTYYENVVIGKSIDLIGEDRNNTIVDGFFSNNIVINVTGNFVDIIGFTIKNSGTQAEAGIKLVSDYNRVINNIIFNNTWGILLYLSDYNNISYNIINNNWGIGCSIKYSSYNLFSYNIISENNDGMSISYYSNNNNIINSSITKNKDEGIVIYYHSDYNNVLGNNISKNEYGVGSSYWSEYTNVSSNFLSNHHAGINFYQTKFTTILRNDISDHSHFGIYMAGTSHDSSLISKNIVKNNEWGIYFGSCHENIISNNTITLNRYGLWIDHCFYNIFLNNTITDNNKGIYLLGGAGNNLIYNNYFNNNNNYGDNGNNIWNISKTLGTNIIGGPYLGGNYWNNYTGVDTDGDGLGNTNIPYGPGDYLPLTTSQPQPDTIYIDDDFDSSTPGWNHTHFDNIQDGIDAVAENGTVYVCNGTYYENVVISKTIDLIGENKNSTFIIENINNNVLEINAPNVSVKNFMIIGGGHSIDIDTDYNEISNNIVKDSEYAAIEINGNFNLVSKNNVFGNISNPDGHGIELRNSEGTSQDNIVRNNIIIDCYYGIDIVESFGVNLCSNNTIFENLITNCSIGIYINGDNNHNKLYHNNLVSNNQNAYDECNNIWDNGYPSGGNYWDDYNGTDSDGDGIGDKPYNISGGSNQDNYPLMHPITSPPLFVWVDDTFDSSISGWNTTHFNNIQNGVDAVDMNGTVYVFNGTYYENIIVNKTIKLIGEDKNNTIIDANGFGNGINITANVVRVENFMVKGAPMNNEGIRVFSNNNIIDTNIITNNYIGIIFDTANNNNFSNNQVISNNWEGVYLWYSDSNSIYDNSITDNFNGIKIYFSYNNKIISNIIFSNLGRGIYFGTSANGNIIYHNNLQNNFINANDECINSWDNSYPSGGNYWDDYTGFDSDGDGIGDIPYNISGGSNQDNYPLMAPYNPWSVTLDFSTPDNISDYVIFGEKPGAKDGQDSYDVPKPPMSNNPFVYAWFDADLSEPYNMLWEDYRYYPDANKTWDLYIICDTSGPLRDTSTNITISWYTDEINQREYDFVDLFSFGNPVLLVDMKNNHSYSFEAEFNVVYHFQIKCSINNPPVADFNYTVDDLTFNFDASSSYDPDGIAGHNDRIVEYIFDFGDGTKGYYEDWNVNHTYTHHGIYLVNLTVTDTFGLNDSFEKMVSLPNFLSLKYRWNMINLPFNESLSKNNIIVINNSIEYNWTDAVQNGIVLNYFYGWNKTGQSYDVVDTLNPGCGYWAWVYYDCEILVAGNMSDDNYITSLENRWNMMGNPSDETIDKNDIVVFYNGTYYSWFDATTSNNEEETPLVLSYIYGWDRTLQNYIISDEFNVGYGYWIYAYYNCILLRPTV